MATLAVAAARRAATLARTPARSHAASLIPRRGLSGAAGILHLPIFLNFKFILYSMNVKLVSRLTLIFHLIFLRS